MVEGFAAKVFGAAAASHVVAMDGVARFKSRLCQTAGVAGRTRSFEAMHQNQFSGWQTGGRSLGMHQDLNAGFGLIKSRLHRKALFIQLPLPVVAGDGEQVRIPEERNERVQNTILGKLLGTSEDAKKNEGAPRRPPPQMDTRHCDVAPERHRKPMTAISWLMRRN